MPATSSESENLDPRVALALERSAVAAAALAGEHLCAALNERPVVEFKRARPGAANNSNPVSAVDRRVELLIRERLTAEYPSHAIIGEELDARSCDESEFVWAVDPLDGTSNYINGLPLFASSIGVLYRGRPVAGAIWCAATHALRPGIYHARHGGELCFDGRAHARHVSGPWRQLGAEPGWAPVFGALWDTRVIASAALEMALVAAGVLAFAHLSRPSIWDVVAGMALLDAANCRAVALRDTGPETLLYFGSPRAMSLAELSQWNEPLMIGDDVSLARAFARDEAPVK